MREPTSGELWARYVDWCSARVAARFLELSSDQIWALADRSRSTHERGAAGRESPYLELVRQVTLELFAELRLPDYHQWLARYRADPAEFEAEMVGFGEPAPAVPPGARE